MRRNCFRAILLSFAGFAALDGADIHGMIVIRHKLTQRKVTVTADAYQRGAGVEVGSAPADNDPLGYERSHVAIYVEGERPTRAVSATIGQQNRRFLPDLVVIPNGSTVSFPNLDPIFHNVFSLSKPKSFDLGNYAKGQSRTVTFPKPGIVLVNCRLHTNMTAAIVITPNQWSAIADASGRFTLQDVAPGAYTLVAWHKTAGFFRQTVKVGETGAIQVEFVIPLDENGMRIPMVGM